MLISDFLDPQKYGWLKSRGVSRIMAAISGSGFEARAVGGAVRDSLLGHAPEEIDLAVNLPPEKVIEVLAKAGIKTVPTGIEYGTVTAVVEDKGYEITSLRHDLETDGRRAKVAFTDDWQADAARRDFTMNALYADEDGKIYDYFGGREDLAAGVVRFIGDAEGRIKEDVLRILRFFRFYAWFGKGEADKNALAACQELKKLVPLLSMERVWRETVKLLAAENPLPAWILMKDTGVLAEVLPEAVNIARLGSLLKIETKYGMPPAPLVRLGALIFGHDYSAPDAQGHVNLRASMTGSAVESAAEISRRLKLSNREASKIKTLAHLPALLHGKLDAVSFRRALYEHGADACRDAALLVAADSQTLDLEPFLDRALGWQRPVFPLSGSDLLKLGFMQGPKMGEVLRTLEERWIAEDFRLTREECLAEAKRLM